MVDAATGKPVMEYDVPHVKPGTPFSFEHPWARSNPADAVVLPVRDTAARKSFSEMEYQRTCAHEFGHVLGLEDAYPDDEQDRPDAPVTVEVPGATPVNGASTIMRNKYYACANDIEMAVEAFLSGEKQYYVSYVDDWLNDGKLYARIKREQSPVIRSY
jgi:hypothetical protein